MNHPDHVVRDADERSHGLSSPDATLAEAEARLRSSDQGLTSAEAHTRLDSIGPNRLSDDEGTHPLAVFFRQFRSPMVLILLAAAVASFALGEIDQATIVITIVVASTGLGFFQEYNASHAVAELRRRVAVSATVLRDGRKVEVPTAELVPGDVLELHAGSLVPADAVILDADALMVDEAVLTGESFPANKFPPAPGANLSAENRIHMGTSVRSGEARALITMTGNRTQFGELAAAVAATSPETSFSRGTRRFGLLMTQIMFVLVTVVLLANVLLGRPVIDSLLFAAALAVGLTPELLPAIVTVTLSQGVRRLSERGVLVRRLVAIENLGSMDILCTDKTGTLTIGAVTLESALGVQGEQSARVLSLGALNAGLQTALPNPLDAAILARCGEAGVPHDRKRGEIPYDFERKRLSVLVADEGGITLICKGSPDSVLGVCAQISTSGSPSPLTDERLAGERLRIAGWGKDGHRVIAIASRRVAPGEPQTADLETGLTLEGYLLFTDPLKPEAAESVANLRANGIELRIITGDSRFVAEHVATTIGMATRLCVGDDLQGLTDQAFARRISDRTVFAEITPSQKERIVSALKRSHTVGYLGDGINDAPALRAADIGISVDNAVDAARAAADVILLKQDLEVLLDGIVAGRTAFGNTLKYMAITISSNFGNMLSMATASIFLPFLPMQAPQVLLNNLLADLPMLAISTDRVDADLLERPRDWDFHALVRSMVSFGVISSIFDAVTFAVLLGYFHASAPLFQSAWFTESLLTQVAAIAVMRTRKRFFMSFPSPLLATLAIVIAILAVLLPFVPIVQSLFGFVSLPLPLLACIAGIVIVYVAGAEYAKHAFGILEPSDRKTPGFRRRRKSSLKPPAEHPDRDRKRHQPNEEQR